MSKNITIQEGGVAKQLTVDKLKTNLVGGGFQLWVPEDSVELTTKSITANGTYKAVDDGYYGYSEVTVSGIGIATGIGDDGNEHSIHTDPSTGELVDTVLASYIEVTRLPDKTEYNNNETIDFSGIEVKAYDKNKTLLGVVPFNELVFPETKADINKADMYTDGQGFTAKKLMYTQHTNRTVYSDGQEIDQTVYCCDIPLGVYTNGNQATYGGDFMSTILATRYHEMNYIARLDGDDREDLFVYFNGVHGDVEQYGWFKFGGSSGRTKLKEFTSASFSEYLTDLPMTDVNPVSVDVDSLYTSGQRVPVQWPRTGDGKVLETFFYITVNGSEMIGVQE